MVKEQGPILSYIFITLYLFSRFVSGPFLCGAGHRLEVRCYLGGRARRL